MRRDASKEESLCILAYDVLKKNATKKIRYLTGLQNSSTNKIINMKIFNFEDNTAIGTVFSVDTATLIVKVEELESINLDRRKEKENGTGKSH